MDQDAGKKHGYALQPEQGWIYRFGIDFVVKAGEVREAGSAAFLEYTTRRGEEPDDHIHPGEDEMFYVLEGALTFRCDDRSFELEKGGFVFLPAGVTHGYSIRSEGSVRLIAVTAPVRQGTSSGWGGFVADMQLGQGELVAKPKEDD